MRTREAARSCLRPSGSLHPQMNHYERKPTGSPSREREAKTLAASNKMPRRQEAAKTERGGDVVADRVVAGGLARLG
jgi:hypothetical protein